MTSTDIMGMFNINADEYNESFRKTPSGIFVEAIRHVAGTLKDNGVNVTLDVRPYRHGCPPHLLGGKGSITINGTLVLEGLPVDFTAVENNRDYNLYMHVGTSTVMGVMMSMNDKREWYPLYGADLTATIAKTLGVLRRENEVVNGYDMKDAETGTGARIEVSSPLKLKKPGATS